MNGNSNLRLNWRTDWKVLRGGLVFKVFRIKCDSENFDFVMHDLAKISMHGINKWEFQSSSGVRRSHWKVLRGHFQCCKGRRGKRVTLLLDAPLQDRTKLCRACVRVVSSQYKAFQNVKSRKPGSKLTQNFRHAGIHVSEVRTTCHPKCWKYTNQEI